MTRPSTGASVVAVLVMSLPALSLPALSVGQADAAEVVPTCRGKAATIVGSEGAWVRGTDGDDVVVTEGASYVETGDGDDTVCVTGFFDDDDIGFVTVYTGAGSDLIDTVAAKNEVDAGLNPRATTSEPPTSEADVYIGGALRDNVTAGGGGAADIDTGGGTDQVDSFGANTSLRVDLGQDTVSDFFISYYDAGAEPRGPAMVTGSGTDSLSLSSPLFFDAPAGSWDIDNITHTVTRDGAPILSFSGITRFQVALDEAAVHFTGGPGPESLGVDGNTGQVGPVSADLGAGDDAFGTDDLEVDVDGGPGRDRLDVEPVFYDDGVGYLSDYLRIDLARGTIQFSDDTPVRRAVGFEDAAAYGGRPITIHGTSGPNRLEVSPYACFVAVAGRGGDDALRFSPFGQCRGGDIRRRRLLGGAGNDTIRGSRAGDVLIGNAGDDAIDAGRGDDVVNGGDGTDSADGGEGTDRCREVETALGCES